MRLIDADEFSRVLIEHMIAPFEYNDYDKGLYDASLLLENTPTIEPPTTEWLGNHTPFRCKRCGHYSDSRTPYCAYCGKKATNSAG